MRVVVDVCVRGDENGDIFRDIYDEDKDVEESCVMKEFNRIVQGGDDAEAEKLLRQTGFLLLKTHVLDSKRGWNVVRAAIQCGLRFTANAVAAWLVAVLGTCPVTNEEAAVWGATGLTEVLEHFDELRRTALADNDKLYDAVRAVLTGPYHVTLLQTLFPPSSSQ
jgi:hypothetical protein